MGNVRLVMVWIANAGLCLIVFFATIPSSGWHGWSVIGTLGVYFVVGATAAIWTRSALSVAVPAALGFLLGLGMLKWAVHLSDTSGRYAPPMIQYLVGPSGIEVLLGCGCACAAAVGYFGAKRLREVTG
jgi:hypothetical protein